MTENEYRQLVASSPNFEDLKEISKQFYESNGIISRVQNVRGGGNAGIDEISIVSTSDRSTPPKLASPPSSAPASFQRFIYPHGNVRLEIQATSEQELDEIENRVRALYKR